MNRLSTYDSDLDHGRRIVRPKRIVASLFVSDWPDRKMAVAHSSCKSSINEVVANDRVRIVTWRCPRQDINDWKGEHADNPWLLGAFTIDAAECRTGFDVDCVVSDGAEGRTKDDDPAICGIRDYVALHQTRLAGQTNAVGPLRSSVAERSTSNSGSTYLLKLLRTTRSDIVVLDSHVSALEWSFCTATLEAPGRPGPGPRTCEDTTTPCLVSRPRRPPKISAYLGSYDRTYSTSWSAFGPPNSMFAPPP